MAHFAEINKDNIVKRVIVVHNNEITIDNQELEFVYLVSLFMIFLISRRRNT